MRRIKTITRSGLMVFFAFFFVFASCRAFIYAKDDVPSTDAPTVQTHGGYTYYQPPKNTDDTEHFKGSIADPNAVTEQVKKTGTKNIQKELKKSQTERKKTDAAVEKERDLFNKRMQSAPTYKKEYSSERDVRVASGLELDPALSHLPKEQQRQAQQKALADCAQNSNCPGYEQVLKEHPELAKAAEALKKKGPLEKIIEGVYGAKLTMFNQPVDFSNLSLTVYRMLSWDSMQSASTGSGGGIHIYGLFKNQVFPIANTIGISLLTLLILWRFFKESLELERFTWQRAFMLFVRFMVLLALMNASFTIIEQLATVAMDVIQSLPIQGTDVGGIGEAISQAIADETGWIEKVAIFVLGLSLAFAYYGTAISVIVLVVVRFFKIYIAMSMAPIPIALTVDESRGGDVWRYFFWSFGLFLQAPIIAIGLYIYSGLLSEINTGSASGISVIIPLAIGISLCNGLLSAFLHGSEQITERLLP